jgi:hypothetical protein
MDVIQFGATLYFDLDPQLLQATLIASWGREGYTCDAKESAAAFEGLRGGTYVQLAQAVPADHGQRPKHYPPAVEVDIDYATTYCIDHTAGYADFLQARWQAALQFRVIDDPDAPRAAHNEWVAVMLGIHQAYPLRAVWLHELGVLVGREDLDEYLGYADSHAEAPPQFAPMLAFGVLVQCDGGVTRAWSSGLEHFNHPNLYVEALGLAPRDALRIVFNNSYAITGGSVMSEGDTAQTDDLNCRVEEGVLDGQPALRMQLI